jgi:hypothetical protein
MIGNTRWWPAAALGAVAVIGLLGFAQMGPSSQTEPLLLAGRPECPHDWDFKAQQMAIVGSNIDVPEFHDCQRFIVVEGNDTSYQALYAIFAAETLRASRPFVLQAWIPVAEIYAEGRYPQLGISTPYSCLFLRRVTDTSFDARMLPLGSNADVDCRRVPDVQRGRQLTVHRTTVPWHFAPNDYPPVARWDWDSVHSKQYIGVNCGDAWCEVGDADLPAWQPPTGVQLGNNRKALRTRLIKGWYDEQLVAIRDGQGRTITSAMRGIIYPHAELDDHSQMDAFDQRWIPVADVALEVPPGTPASIPQQYKARMNLDITQPGAGLVGGSLNRIALCRGTAARCGVPEPNPTCSGDPPAWWSRIEPANGGEAKFYCVVRRGHGRLAATIPGHRVPGTARWRWMASDEGTWNACVQGCCEVGGT